MNPRVNPQFKLDLPIRDLEPKGKAALTKLELPQKTDQVASAVLSKATANATKVTTASTSAMSALPKEDLFQKALGLFNQPVKSLHGIAKESHFLEGVVKDSIPDINPKLLDAIEQNNEKLFQDELTKLKPNQAAEQVSSLLKQFALKEKNENYQFIVDNTAKVFPKLDDLVTRFHVMGLQANIITPDGIKLLVNYLQEKNSIRQECIVCADKEKFQENLQKLCQRSGDFDCSMIVRTRTEHDKENHMTPIYIKKENGKMHLVVTDSIGVKEGMHGTKIRLWARKVLEENKMKYHGYYFANKRQQDKTNCPIFSLKDVSNYSKIPNFLDFVLNESKNAGPDDTGDDYTNFSKLPPEMMKTTQSVRAIEEYDHHAPKVQENIPRVYDAISKYREQKVVRGEQKEVNTLIERRFLKYERLLIAKVIKEGI